MPGAPSSFLLLQVVVRPGAPSGVSVHCGLLGAPLGSPQGQLHVGAGSVYAALR